MTPESVLSREAVRELDRRAIEEYGIPSIVLMENAGRACAEEAIGMLRGATVVPVVVLCGPGNNGGDGLVIARTLDNRGYPVRVVFVGPPERLEGGSEDVRTNARLWRGLGRSIDVVAPDGDVGALRDALAGAPLVVDALFGTGLTRALEDPWAGVIRLVEACHGPVLAVDLPSGLDANTGAILGAAARADVTPTFVARKPGLLRGEGPRLCGRVRVVEIGIPRALVEEALG